MVLEVHSYLDGASTLLQVVFETVGVHVPLNGEQRFRNVKV